MAEIWILRWYGGESGVPLKSTRFPHHKRAAALAWGFREECCLTRTGNRPRDPRKKQGKAEHVPDPWDPGMQHGEPQGRNMADSVLTAAADRLTTVDCWTRLPLVGKVDASLPAVSGNSAQRIASNRGGVPEGAFCLAELVRQLHSVSTLRVRPVNNSTSLVTNVNGSDSPVATAASSKNLSR